MRMLGLVALVDKLLAWPSRWLTTWSGTPASKLVGSGLPTMLNTSYWHWVRRGIRQVW